MKGKGLPMVSQHITTHLFSNAGTSRERPILISQMIHRRLRWCQSSDHPWHPLLVGRITGNCMLFVMLPLCCPVLLECTSLMVRPTPPPMIMLSPCSISTNCVYGSFQSGERYAYSSTYKGRIYKYVYIYIYSVYKTAVFESISKIRLI